ncbi:MAG: RDD family protein [Friedmanniella sp.]|jgi:uncharacterized RDD family membrane protein YckC
MMQGEISLVPREARPYQGQGAGIVTRVVANTVDAVGVTVALAAAYLVVNAAAFVIHPRGFQLVKSPVVFSLATVLVVFTVYLTAAWSITGRTYGDHLMGLRVVGRRGRPLAVPRALARAVLCVAFPVGLLWCIGSPSRRSLQDALLRTSVIYDWTPRHPSGGAGGVASRPAPVRAGPSRSR